MGKRKVFIPLIFITLLVVIVVSIVDFVGLWEPDISPTPTPTPASTVTPDATRIEALYTRVVDGNIIKVLTDGGK